MPVPDASVPGRIALDGAAMQDVRDNRKSLRVDGGKIAWKELALLDRPSFTVEFFAKIDSLDAPANLIRLTNGNNADGNPIWALYKYNVTGGADIRLATYDGASINHDYIWPNASGLADGSWHHWALTFDGSRGTQTEIKLYRDYAQVGNTITTSYLLAYPSNNHTLTIGGTSNNPCHIHGNFDELRVSAGVLPVSAFLRAQPNGTIVIVR